VEHDDGYVCQGGLIQTVIFLDDDDLQISQSTSTCTLFQDASWSQDDNDISIEFGNLFEGCEVAGDDSDCDCYDDGDEVVFTFSSDCSTLNGPNGEVCRKAKSTADCNRRSCPEGEKLVNDPNHTPQSNGCGPASIPVKAPSFSFLDCCNQHDLCYSDCSSTKKKCDDDFYSCMFCGCSEEYDNFVSETLCEELACTYYQAVDELGCDAYETSQENACICEGSKDVERVYKEVPSKFGPEPLDMNKSTRLICSAPFSPECDSSKTSKNNSPSSNSPNSPNSSSGAESLLPFLFLFAFLLF